MESTMLNTIVLMQKHVNYLTIINVFQCKVHWALGFNKNVDYLSETYMYVVAVKDTCLKHLSPLYLIFL